MAEPMDEAVSIDLSGLEEMLGGKKDKVRDFAYKFVATTRVDMAKLESALTSQDVGQVRELGHHIKSPAMMMGALGFADLCRALETAPDDLSGAHELVGQLRVLLDKIEAQINALFS